MTDEAFRVPQPDEGLFEVAMTTTVVGEERVERAVYRGNPFTRADAELVTGRDLVRGDNAIYTNSGAAVDTSGPAPAATWAYPEQHEAPANDRGSR